MNPNDDQLNLSSSLLHQTKIQLTEGTAELDYNVQPSQPSTSNNSNLLRTPEKSTSCKRYTNNIDLSTLRRACKTYNVAILKLQQKNRQIRTLQNKVSRLKAKVKTLTDFLIHLRSKNLLSEEMERILQDSSDNLGIILQRRLEGRKTKFGPELRAFAIILQYYSTKAYNYVRKQFKNVLSHLDTISKWFQVVTSNPGFTKENILAIETKPEMEK